jgi:hypothetical protein
MNDDPYFHGCYLTDREARKDRFVKLCCLCVGFSAVGSLATQAFYIFLT